MINHAWTVICQKSIIDRETNNVSLDVLEQLNVTIPTIPTEAKGVIFPMPIEIVSLWYRGYKDPGIKGDGRLRIVAPNNKDVGFANINIDLATSHRYRTRVRLNNLSIPKGTSGYFHFIVELKSNNKWIEITRIPLEVNTEQNRPLNTIKSRH